MAKINQVNQFTDNSLQTEFENIYRGMSQIEFANTFETGLRTTNIQGYMLEITAVASAEVSAAHDLKRAPSGYLVVGQNTSGTAYDGATTNTEGAFYLRSTTNGVYKIILI